MDFVPIIKTITATATVAIDVSSYIEKGKAGVMFYDACTVTLSDGTNSIAVALSAYQPLRLPVECTSVTSDTTTTMIAGSFDNPAYA